MTAIKNPSLPLWRIDAGNRKESMVRDMARKIDLASGNGDGKVSLSEIDLYDSKLAAVMGSPDYSPHTATVNDPVKTQAWVDRNTLYYVREDVTHPHRLARDLVVHNFGEQLNVLMAALIYGVKLEPAQ